MTHVTWGTAAQWFWTVCYKVSGSVLAFFAFDDTQPCSVVVDPFPDIVDTSTPQAAMGLILQLLFLAQLCMADVLVDLSGHGVLWSGLADNRF